MGHLPFNQEPGDMLIGLAKRDAEPRRIAGIVDLEPAWEA